MNILVINCGSSSLKYQLLNIDTNEVKVLGMVDRIGMPNSKITHCVANRKKMELTVDIPNHDVAVRLVLDSLICPDNGVIKNLNEIYAVGHRVVHAADKFSESVLITNKVIKAIKDCSVFAPLHNPANLAGIEACSSYMPNVPQVAVFDTAFHQTMPPRSYIYALPYEVYEKYGIRRYGFHGTSHKYVSLRVAGILGKPIEKLKIITCHLGNGASIAAICHGKVVDTSMGLTPLEGLSMGTRCGDIDPEVVLFLMEKKNMTVQQMRNYLNKESGVLGISGVSSDFRDIEKEAEKGNHRAQLALDVFTHRVQKYIGAYVAVMDGVDGIVFTAGIGENSPEIRRSICKNLSHLGISIDEEKNNTRGQELDISTAQASCRVVVIPTNEEWMIAIETKKIVKAKEIQSA